MKKEAVVAVEQSTAAQAEVAAELEALNCFTKTPLGEEEVYLFSVRLCDNQIDRDLEYFDRAALEQLAPLFVGKSGIFDHNWSAKHQTARIYRTEVISEAGVVPESGEVFAYLKGFAYMLRSEGNQDLIADIEAGIKKEVSVSCAVSRHVCSICGNDLDNRLLCTHVKGREYEGNRCVVRLTDPTDAFEWSFVAVPAQRNAGVLKAAKLQDAWERTFGKESSSADWSMQFARLQKEAECGRHYLSILRKDVLRLGLLAQKELGQEILTGLVEKLGEEELLELKVAFERQAAKRLPLFLQLPYQKASAEMGSQEDQVFCI